MNELIPFNEKPICTKCRSVDIDWEFEADARNISLVCNRCKYAFSMDPADVSDDETKALEVDPEAAPGGPDPEDDRGPFVPVGFEINGHHGYARRDMDAHELILEMLRECKQNQIADGGKIWYRPRILHQKLHQWAKRYDALFPFPEGADR